MTDNTNLTADQKQKIIRDAYKLIYPDKTLAQNYVNKILSLQDSDNILKELKNYTTQYNDYRNKAKNNLKLNNEYKKKYNRDNDFFVSSAKSNLVIANSFLKKLTIKEKSILRRVNLQKQHEDFKNKTQELIKKYGKEEANKILKEAKENAKKVYAQKQQQTAQKQTIKQPDKKQIQEQPKQQQIAPVEQPTQQQVTPTQQNGPNIKQKFAQAGKTFVNSLKNAAKSLKTSFSKLKEASHSLISNLKNKIQTKIEEVKNKKEQKNTQIRQDNPEKIENTENTEKSIDEILKDQQQQTDRLHAMSDPRTMKAIFELKQELGIKGQIVEKELMNAVIGEVVKLQNKEFNDEIERDLIDDKNTPEQTDIDIDNILENDEKKEREQINQLKDVVKDKLKGLQGMQVAENGARQSTLKNKASQAIEGRSS